MKKAKKNKCSLHVFDGKKWLHGMAAVSYDVNRNYGGYDDFVSTITKTATRKAATLITPIVVEEVLSELVHPKLTVVKGA